MSQDSDKVKTNYLSQLEFGIVRRYDKYQSMVKKQLCTVNNKPILELKFDTFNINLTALKESVYQIMMDFRILEFRRGKLIKDLRMSEGKIAGAIVYRLSRAHIIHNCRTCNNCHEKCFARLNTICAITIGLDYIHKKYTDLPEGIRKELIYTIRHRHVNQETLGLVFDALLATNNKQTGKK